MNKNTTWNELLPAGVEMQDLYTFGAAILVFAATMIFGRSMVVRTSHTHNKIKELRERRVELKSSYLDPKRKKKKKAEENKNLAFMQIVVKILI